MMSATFSSASGDIADGIRLDIGRGRQILTLAATSTDNAGTATFKALLVDESDGTAADGVVVRDEDITITAGARRTKPDGTASGGYVCSVSFATSGNQNLDLTGINDNAAWYIVPDSMGTLNNVTLYVGSTHKA